MDIQSTKSISTYYLLGERRDIFQYGTNHDTLNGNRKDIPNILLLNTYELLADSLTIQSYVNLQFDDRESALEDLCLVLHCNSCIFDSRVHKNAFQRLISIQNEFSSSRVY